MPCIKTLIGSDVLFNQAHPFTCEVTKEERARWVKDIEELEKLGAEVVIPGHGEPTDMATVRRYTRDYLVYLREKVREVIDSGGTLQDAYNVDQSPYMHLPTAEFLAKRNAGRVFQSMEFDF